MVRKRQVFKYLPTGESGLFLCSAHQYPSLYCQSGQEQYMVFAAILENVSVGINLTEYQIRRDNFAKHPHQHHQMADVDSDSNDDGRPRPAAWVELQDLTELTRADYDVLLKRDGWEAPMNVRTKEYVPYWTDPNWNPAVETSIDGRLQRAVRGDASQNLRPAVLAIDQQDNPTQYAKYVELKQRRNFISN